MNEREWERLEAGSSAGERARAACPVRKGDRVRLRPRPGGDVYDLALSGRDARVTAIEQDYDGKLHVSVVLDDDPGISIGPRRPGHRLFFSPDEVEVLGVSDPAAPETTGRDVLVAGIGNIFLGDDGFGVEVVQRLARRALPPGVRVADYGIRGYDLAYALADQPARTILVDACPRGEPPGTVYVIRPDLDAVEQGVVDPATYDAHTMNPLAVLRLARSMGATLEQVLLVGCEPATLGPEEGHLGLSHEVEAAVDRAVTLIETLLARPESADQVSSSPPPSC